ncbi:MAG: PqqD family protein [Proteobacteria bacterium]|nr:PqqD family protein [Pseudomonadota bacterium]
MIREIKIGEKYQRSEQILFKVLEGETILVPVNSQNGSANQDALFTLANSGALIWSLLDGTHTVQQLIEQVVEEYDAPEGQVRQDVITFLENLAVRGMISQ